MRPPPGRDPTCRARSCAQLAIVRGAEGPNHPAGDLRPLLPIPPSSSNAASRCSRNSTPAQIDGGADASAAQPRRFEPNEVHRAVFGEVGAPACLVAVGLTSPSRGKDPFGNREDIVHHMPGMMAGEVSQLAGGPSFVEGARCARRLRGRCRSTPATSARSSSATPEVGELLMRAFILRRVALIRGGRRHRDPGQEQRAPTPCACRTFFGATACRIRCSIPDTDCLTALDLVERLAISADDLPIAVCPDGSRAQEPTEKQLAQCQGLLPQFGPTPSSMSR